MSLLPPDTVRKLQETLHAKAKAAPGYRFYSLYDKVYRRDVLAHAYDCAHANRGEPGVDGQTFDDIETYGRDRWLDEVAQELREKTYQPQAVRRVKIPKPDGGQRPLGIPTIKDRVVQMAALLVLDPIFEADLQPEQFAYRLGCGAFDALTRVQALLDSGHREVVDADLSGYFDSIPHAELLKSVARRISDGHVLALIKRWLEVPVEEKDARGKVWRTNRNKNEGRGSPQGSPLSPLLANIYMRRFLLGWKRLGHDRRLDAHIVNYADDFVICCRRTSAEALTATRDMMSKLKLTVNEAKTRLCRVGEDPFDFLGYTFGWLYSPRTGHRYIGPRPAQTRIRRICSAIREITSRKWTFLEPREMVGTINRRLVGWANYFSLGRTAPAYGTVMMHTCQRLRQWLGWKYRVRGPKRARFSDRYLRDELGLVWLPALPRPQPFPWAKA
jgi:group II intron reverse transcriptase/maturase